MSFTLDWKQLLSEKRSFSEISARVSEKELSPEHRDIRTPFERDYDRVIFSAPFRRLARKTQVHPFAEMDQIHNRLTHTLEVASVGRSLAYALGRMIATRRELPAGDRSKTSSASCKRPVWRMILATHPSVMRESSRPRMGQGPCH